MATYKIQHGINKTWDSLFFKLLLRMIIGFNYANLSFEVYFKCQMHGQTYSNFIPSKEAAHS